MHKVCALVLVVDQWSPANILICWYYHRYCISAWASMLSDIRQCVNFLESFWCRTIPRVIYTYQMFTDTISANKVIFKLFPASVTDRCHKRLTSSRIIAKTVCKWTDLLISNIFVGRVLIGCHNGWGGCEYYKTLTCTSLDLTVPTTVLTITTYTLHSFQIYCSLTPYSVDFESY